LPHGETRRRVARGHLLVISSRMEGGANVICEAVRAGTPVIASDIPGNRGMLGEDYLGYYPVADTAALASILARAETDAGFYARLSRQCAARSHFFDPAREAAAVQGLLP
jgi:glycosyltransferase involved in cell wall biosynthesis